MDNIFLGINVSHGASAALMINGKIVKAYQEERFNKIKNFTGYPKRSIQECINFIAKQKKRLILQLFRLITIIHWHINIHLTIC